MAVNDPTTNYGWNLPDVGGDADAWGTILNTLFGEDGGAGTKGIDQIMKDNADAAANAANLTSGIIPDARIQASGVTQHQAALALAATQLTSGVLADARVQASNVTQHQAALALAASQVTSGTFADARVAESNVTQHQAALALAGSQITSGTVADARLSSNVILADSPWNKEGATAATDLVTHKVTGDTNDRFEIRADGQLEWGSGSAVPDVVLRRGSAGVLTLDDTLEIVAEDPAMIVNDTGDIVTGSVDRYLKVTVSGVGARYIPLHTVS